MNLNDYRVLFMACSLGVSLLAAMPALGLFVPFRIEEPFSELSILGPAHLAKDYPFNVGVNTEASLFVTLRNHMGGASYYRIQVKVRNQTESLPTETGPSAVPPLYEFGVFLLDGNEWESAVRFRFLEVSRTLATVQVRRMWINNLVFEMDSSTSWDPEYRGFYFQLFFELWQYDVAVHDFVYNNRFVGVWLNMTA